jgi:hypothetical protein
MSLRAKERERETTAFRWNGDGACDGGKQAINVPGFSKT